MKFLKAAFSAALVSASILFCVVQIGKLQQARRFTSVADVGVPATVIITDPKNGSFGSGVFISPNGHVLTAAHVVENDEVVLVQTLSGEGYFGQVIAKDKRRDLALLKINVSSKTATPYLEIAPPTVLKQGQEVLVVGHPFGFEFSVTHGIVSAVTRDIANMGYNVVQSDAGMNFGNSGGPVIDMEGRLVGIASFVYHNPGFVGIGFCVSPAQIHEFLALFHGLKS